MIGNEAFTLTEEELTRYNEWAEGYATAMCNADIESWTLEVTFSFSNMGTDIVAHCADADDRSHDLIIRSESDW